VGRGGGRSAIFCVGLAQGFLDTCLHEKGKAMAVEKVGGGRIHWLAGRHLASYRLSQVSGAHPWPYKYPPTKVSQHAPHFGDSTCKPPIVSVVAKRSLVGRVVRL
jgi:hypothetical protein